MVKSYIVNLYLCNMDYKGYNILKDGTVYKDGKLIATNRIYVNGSWHNGIDIANKLFSEVKPQTVVITKQYKNKALRKLVHGNTGRTHTDKTKQAIRVSVGGRQIVIEGVSYPSITTAAKELNVTRDTIYRRINKT